MLGGGSWTDGPRALPLLVFASSYRLCLEHASGQGNCPGLYGVLPPLGGDH
jgi:hypothetical protein